MTDYCIKKTWTTKEVRKLMSDPKRSKEGEPCFVCGKNEAITELHHACSIAEFTDLLNQGSITVDAIETHCVWLCPNCHTYYHRLHAKGFNEKIARSMVRAGYTNEQYEVLHHTLEGLWCDDYCYVLDGGDEE